MINLWPGSSASSSTQLRHPEFGLLPTDTSLAKPSPRRAAQSTVPSMFPLAHTKLVVPAGNGVHLEHSIHREREAAWNVDESQCLGPSTRTPSVRARATSPPAGRALGAGVGESVAENRRDGHAARSLLLIARSTESRVMMNAWFDRSGRLGEVA